MRVLLLLLQQSSAAASAATSTASVAAPVERWGRWEGSWHAATAKIANPFTDVELTVELHGPSGGSDSSDSGLVSRSSSETAGGASSVLVRGFYDGEGLWRARFMPPTVGAWTYRTRCATVSALDGKSGSFTVAAAAATNHGPVRVRENSTTFAHADGTPFHAVGTTIYGLAGGVWGSNTGNVNKTAESLATLATSPFNKVRMMAFPVDSVARGGATYLPYELTKNSSGATETDRTRFNLAFWQRLDRTITSLLELDIQARPFADY